MPPSRVYYYPPFFLPFPLLKRMIHSASEQNKFKITVVLATGPVTISAVFSLRVMSRSVHMDFTGQLRPVISEKEAWNQKNTRF